MPTKSYLMRCLPLEIDIYLVETETTGETGRLLSALMPQCQSQNKNTICDVHQQMLNIKMSKTESLVSYQGRVQKLVKRLTNTSSSVPDAHKWGIITHGILDVYRTCVRMITLPFEYLAYHELITKIQKIARE